MPRPKKPGAPEPKRRSRNGCWNCKAKKVKCGEEKPACANCQRQNEACDYSIRLNWDRSARNKRPDSQDGWPTSGSSTQTTFALNSNPPTSPTPPASGGSPLDPAMMMTQFATSIRDPSTAGQPSNALAGSSSPAPSSMSSLDGSRQPGAGIPTSYPSMLPPFQVNANNQHRRPSAGSESSVPTSEGPPAKRTRFSPGVDPLQPRFNNIEYDRPRSSSQHQAAGPTSYPQSRRSPDPPLSAFGTPNVGSTSTFPPTPAASSTSDDVFAVPYPKRPSLPYPEDDPRRMSVNSLLNQQEEAAKGNPQLKRTGSQQKITFGIDRGLPDYDYPHNNDENAISPMGATSPDSHKSFPGFEEDDIKEFGFGLHGNSSMRDENQTGVEVSIPVSLLPLPSRLQENPMNLLYFNHFINHVARILVPHDCSLNPFRIILPQMAVRDDNLMCLLLAYSASHRARLLDYREPTTRISLWVENVFPNLRHALNDPKTKLSNSTIATAIMLASREIIAPNTFGTAVSWQSHLDLARRIISERGGPEAPKKDRVCYFLMRWFAYLDIISTLMSGREAARYRRPSEVIGLRSSGTPSQPANDPTAPTLSLYTPEYFAPDESDFRIDCLLGFTTRLVSLLARVAHLTRRCDTSPDRYDHTTGDHNPEWSPDHATLGQALRLKDEIETAKRANFEGCPDADVAIASANEEGNAFGISPFTSEELAEKEAGKRELTATNQAFHAAALVHLNRRVLGLRQDDPQVVGPVKEIVSTLKLLRPRGTAETGFLFPMFTAGVEVQDKRDRDLILKRVKGVESSGMVQVTKARHLMEMVWKTGKPWETLVQGEFFG